MKEHGERERERDFLMGWQREREEKRRSIDRTHSMTCFFVVSHVVVVVVARVTC